MTTALALLRLRLLTGKVSNERQLQRAIAQLLPEFTPEFKLNAQDRIDFFFQPERIGVEVKIKGGDIPIARQLVRYEPHCSALILVTAKKVSIPDGLFSIPFHIVWTGLRNV